MPREKVLLRLAKPHTEDRTIRPVFGNYVTRNAGFVAHLQAVKDQIATYIRKPAPKRPLNILLAAPPGNGKSFLIKQLAKWVAAQRGASTLATADQEKLVLQQPIEISFEETYVASLENVGELHEIFHRVQSLNLDRKRKLPVVFFDEIDTGAGGEYHYAKFLAPMWDGTFFVGKEKFFLGRSIFCFAGSTLSLEEESARILKERAYNKLTYDDYFAAWKHKLDEHEKRLSREKLPDFLSRIDSIIAIPPMDKALLGKALDEERLDLACMLIVEEFPEVKTLGRVALRAICDILAADGIRAASRVIFASENDGDLFDFSCLPETIQSQARSADWFKAEDFVPEGQADYKKERHCVWIKITEPLWQQAPTPALVKSPTVRKTRVRTSRTSTRSSRPTATSRRRRRS